MIQRPTLIRIQKRHDRKKFDCGIDHLNRFLANSTKLSSEKRVTRTYVLEDMDNPDIITGYATLTFTSIEIPKGSKLGKKPKGPVPALLLAKLAVSKKYKGKGYGKALLAFAIRKASEVSNEVVGVGLVIDAKNQDAKNFYMNQAGEDLEIIDNTGLKLWLPIDICDAIAKTLSDP